MTTLIGGRYRLGDALGQGGMATVYAAQDTLLGREVALKLLRAELHSDADALERFQREAQIAAGFNHQHIARVYDVGIDPAYGPFFIQELVSGQALDTLLPAPAPQALAWIGEIAAALAAIHGQGLVHCDVKPQNVRITPAGRAVLLDFGIAQTSGSSSGATIFGTPQYLAPERAQGAPSTPAADVYGLGVLFYELLTGQVPLDGTSAQAIVQRHIHEGVPALRQALPGTAAAIEAIIRRATERDPAQRYPSVEAMLRDLQALEQSASSATLAMAPAGLRQTVSIHNTPTMVVRPPASAAAAPQVRASQPAPIITTPAPLPPPPPGPALAQPQASLGPTAPLAEAAPPPMPGATTPTRASRNRRGLLWLGLGLVALLALWMIVRPASDPVVPPAAAQATPTTTLLAPSLIGLQIDEAQGIAQPLGFKIVVAEQIAADAPAGQIISQDPAAETAVAPATVLNVVISSGPAVEPPPPPSSEGGQDNKDKDKDKDRGKDKDKDDD